VDAREQINEKLPTNGGNDFDFDCDFDRDKRGDDHNKTMTRKRAAACNDTGPARNVLMERIGNKDLTSSSRRRLSRHAALPHW
jgi:hypothetical protein